MLIWKLKCEKSCFAGHVFIFCDWSDDKEDQEAWKGDYAMEDQMGDQQPDSTADGRRGEGKKQN